jgi:hypothetical protein
MALVTICILTTPYSLRLYYQPINIVTRLQTVCSCIPCWQCGSIGHLGTDRPWRPVKVTDNNSWRRDCKTRGRGSTKRKTPESTPTSPCVTLLPDEKRWLEAHITALEKQNKELKAKLAELEAPQKTKMKFTIAAPKRANNNVEIQRHISCPKV